MLAKTPVASTYVSFSPSQLGRQSADPFFLPQICNDSAVELTRNCTVFHDFTNSIGGKCCTKDYHKSKGISGRQWSDQDFNVVVAYGNCNHGIDSDKPAPGPKNDPWGPNGLCEDD